MSDDSETLYRLVFHDGDVWIVDTSSDDRDYLESRGRSGSKHTGRVYGLSRRHGNKFDGVFNIFVNGIKYVAA